MKTLRNGLHVFFALVVLSGCAGLAGAQQNGGGFVISASCGTASGSGGWQGSIGPSMLGGSGLSVVSPGASVCPANPFGQMVEKFYQAFLGHPSDPQGAQYWANQLGQTTILNVVSGFLNSDEFNQDLQTAFNHVLSGSRSLGQFPDRLWSWYVDPNQVTNELTESGYTNLHPGNGGFVDALYRDLLDRAPDPAGQRFWEDYLNQGGSRASVVQGFLISQEYYKLQTTQFYQDLLGRAPDASGLAFWPGKPAPEQVGGIAVSQEFMDDMTAQAQACAGTAAGQAPGSADLSATAAQDSALASSVGGVSVPDAGKPVPLVIH